VSLIELNPETPAQPVGSGPPPAYVYRRAGLLVCAILVLALGGAAPQSSRLWWHVARIDLGNTALQSTVVGGGRLFGMEAGTPSLPITAWSLATGRKLWSVPSISGDARLTPLPSGLLIVSSGSGSGSGISVLDAATGAQRWQVAKPTQVLDTRTALVIDERFRPNTEYDSDSGEPGRLYGTGLGNLHTEPAQSTTLRAVDLLTGRSRWSATVPGSITTGWTGSGVVVLSAGRITLRSAATGEVLQEQGLDAGRGSSVGAEVFGDVLLVSEGSYGEAGKIVAYDAGTLARLWEKDEPDSQGNPVTCSGLPCLLSRTEVTMLDPATGAELWRSDAGADLFASGDSMILEAQSTTPKAVVDRRTGRPVLTLTYWSSYAPLPDRSGVLLIAAERGNQLLGLLPAGATKIQPLGRMPGVVPCLPDKSYVACRVPTGVEIYRYLS
jgi:hypothetical protein